MSTPRAPGVTAGTRPLDPTTEPGAVAETARVRRIFTELPVAVLAAAVVSLLVQFAVRKLHLPTASFLPSALSAFSIAAAAAVILFLAARAKWPRWATVASWILPGTVGTVWLSFSLAGSKLYLGGLAWDQTTRVQYLERLTDSASLADLNYAGLPPFYPAGWFWVGGRFANLFGFEGWEAYQPFAIVTIAAAAAAAFVLWSAVVSRRTALLLALATTIVGLRGPIYEPYSWALLALLPPLVFIAWALFKGAVRERADRAEVLVPMAVVGVFLGIAGAVYTLVFGFFLFLLVAFAVAAFLTARTRRLAPAGITFRRLIARLVGIGLFALPFVAAAWVPYLVAMVTHQPEGSTALRYLPENGAEFPLPMFHASISGVVCLAGAVWLLFVWRRSVAARVLAGLAGLCYAWYALSMLASVRQLTLLPFRIEPLLEVTLWCAGVLAGVELLRWVLPRFGHLFDHVPTPSWMTPSRVTGRNAAAGVLALLCVVSGTQTADKVPLMPGFLFSAFADYDLTGTNAHGHRDPEKDGYYLPKLASTVESMGGAKPVVLTAFNDLLSVRPYYGFQTTISGWANPLADYNARAAEIEAWTKSGSAAELVRKLDASKFRAPDVFVLRRDGDSLMLTLTYDLYPGMENIGYRNVSFPAKLFDGPSFHRENVGPFAVIGRAHPA
ncbi:arabinofuranosyltransferase [Amycolatopsis minnesotensis]|uniref:Galactan 5-O-arabinofuranosyltransferase n=1 Tax=Amycolatopsis minnesotensis TaxID=337894 RepID=A0ABN2Q2B1_9PSEU